MEFNDLLRQAGHDPRHVAVMLHTPVRTDQRQIPMAMADQEPKLFEAYQDNHPPIAEANLQRRTLTASFLVDEHSEARFVGLYKVNGCTDRSIAELDADPLKATLISRFRNRTYGDLQARTGRTLCAVFDMSLLTDLAALGGRPVLSRPAGRA